MADDLLPDPRLDPNISKIVDKIPELCPLLIRLNSEKFTRRREMEVIRAWVAKAKTIPSAVLFVEEWLVYCTAMTLEQLNLSVEDALEQFVPLQLLEDEQVLRKLHQMQMFGLKSTYKRETTVDEIAAADMRWEEGEEDESDEEEEDGKAGGSDMDWEASADDKDEGSDWGEGQEEKAPPTKKALKERKLKRSRPPPAYRLRGLNLPSDLNGTLRGYFCSEENATTGLAEMIDALRDARQVPKSVYSKPAWREAVKTSGLSDILAVITDPARRHEVTFPHTSNGRYNWRKFWALVLHKWTPAERLVSGDEIYNMKGARVDDVQFLKIMQHERFLFEMTSCPENVCLLLSYANFRRGWVTWMAATVKALGPGIASVPTVEGNGWDLLDLFRHLCALDDAALRQHLDPSGILFAVFTVSKRGREGRRQASEDAFHPGARMQGGQAPRKKQRKDLLYIDENAATLAKKTPCPKCANDTEKCYREIVVTRREEQEIQKLAGAYLTMAEGTDVVGYQDGRKILNPIDLGFTIYSSRPKVFDQCQRDITVFISSTDGTFVSGVQYQAFSKEVYEDLCESHVEVSEYAQETKRSETQLAGHIRHVGNRVPRGGTRSDGYNMYACQSASTPQTATTLLRAAQVNDVFLEHVRPWAPNVVKELREVSVKAGLAPFGKSSMNAFYCSEYAAPQHPDKDASWSICTQLKKKSQEDEYNFAFSEWGFVIQTEENCLW
ncbi:hypothetical protein C8F01DRAFT_1248697 [Mycena amicta]|nr:hypothetical protein C8F01DRAFT_1248697 [Mycena amicta]